LIDSIKNGYVNAEIVVVISDRKDAFGLERAKQNGISQLYIQKNKLDTYEYNQLLINELKEKGVELVVLAGFLSILDDALVKAFQNRIINIHPSLLPSFCGKGYYGDHVHKAVINSGVKVSGATVHFVDSGIDTGRIILQGCVYLSENETVKSLHEKVLQIEHELLPKAVKLFCDNKINYDSWKKDKK
jgi:phosphoribosylglycinamide formyltransferase-1